MRKHMSQAGRTALVALAVASHSATAFACAVCYGKSDAPMAKGMNWGILVLMAIIGVVLSGIAGFFVYLAKRPALLPDNPETEPGDPPGPRE